MSLEATVELPDLRAVEEPLELSPTEELLKRTDEAAHRTGLSRDEFIWGAVERRVEEVETLQMEGELEAAYRANAALVRQISREFVYVDAEGF